MSVSTSIHPGDDWFPDLFLGVLVRERSISSQQTFSSCCVQVRGGGCRKGEECREREGREGSVVQEGRSVGRVECRKGEEGNVGRERARMWEGQ